MINPVPNKITRDAFLYFSPRANSPKTQFAQCLTCRKFVPQEYVDGAEFDLCVEHGSKVEVGREWSCGVYTIWPKGSPNTQVIRDHAGELAKGIPGSVTPKESGLVKRKVRCENCVFFANGQCNLLIRLNALAPDVFDLDPNVDEHGCCNAQTPADAARADSAGGVAAEVQAVAAAINAPPAPEVVRAAGILCVTTDGRVLLMRRTDGQGWCAPGGHIEGDETAEEAARREFLEETGHEYEGPLTPWTRRQRDGVDFTTFLAHGEEFDPALNSEHDAWQWVDRHFAAASQGLHPGCYVSLKRFDMDELDMAKAIRDGELTSPQRYMNLLLIAIRITSTGAAYRPSRDEFPWRDPALYLNDKFLQRCNGLPVVLEHPDAAMLNTAEFSERIVGTIFLPYLQDDEVWAVAKILNMRVAEMLETESMSTSPGVLCGGVKLRMQSGSTVLIEEKPSLVDHVALLYANHKGEGGLGVWDKGGPMSGVESVDATPPAESSKIDLIVRQAKLHELARSTISR